MLHVMRAYLRPFQSTGNSLQVTVLRIAQKQQQSKGRTDSESLFGLSEEMQIRVSKLLISCQILGKSAMHCTLAFSKNTPQTENKQKKTLSLRKDVLYIKIYTVLSVLLNLVIIGQTCFQLPRDDSHDLLILLPIFLLMSI